MNSCVSAYSGCPPPPLWRERPPAARGLTRNGVVVMMQPMPDGSSDDRAERPGPAGIRILSPADHQIFTRAFAAAAEGDGQARCVGRSGPGHVARQLLQWRYAMDRNSGAKFADIDAMIKTSKPSGAGLAAARLALCPGRSRHHPRHVLDAILRWFGGRPPPPPSVTSGWAKRWRRPATAPRARP